VLDALLADRPQAIHGLLHHAMEVLAKHDMEQALSYLDRVDNRRDLEILTSVVAARLARTDPQRALSWARENARSIDGEAYRTVLMSIAVEDPQLAIQEAQSITNPMHKQQAYVMIGMTVAHRNPEQAIALLDQIPHEQQRGNIARMITDNWLQRDPDAALSWLLKTDIAENDAVITNAAQSLARIDLDSAMRWLPRIDERHQSAWRSTIAAHLAVQQSPAAAESFIARFQHSPEYPQLVSSVAAGIARTDIDAAYRMSDRISSDSARDALYVQLIGQQAQENPQKAAERLASITDPAQRSAAAGQIAGAWAQQDATAAEHWARNLQAGAERDQAIVYLAWAWDDLTPARRALIDSVGDRQVRYQGLTNYVYRVAQSDIRRAESLLDDIDLTHDERRRLERNIQMIRDRAHHIRY